MFVKGHEYGVDTVDIIDADGCLAVSSSQDAMLKVWKLDISTSKSWMSLF